MRIVRGRIRHRSRLRRLPARSAMAAPCVSGLRAALRRQRLWSLFERPAAFRCDHRRLLIRISDRQAHPFPEVSRPPGAGRMVCRCDPCPARTCQLWRQLATGSPDRIAARRPAAAGTRLEPGARNCPRDRRAHRCSASFPRTLSRPRDSAAGGAAVDRAGEKRSRCVCVRYRSFGTGHCAGRRCDDHRRVPRRSGEGPQGLWRGKRRELGRCPNAATGPLMRSCGAVLLR